MKIEVRADGCTISGYVNVTQKLSRPVYTPNGVRCVELIEERAFEQAIKRAGDITVTVDHEDTHIYASTNQGTLTLREDAIGLHADVLITDEKVIELAKAGKIRGWSVGMYNVIDSIEERAGELPLRRVKQMELDHVTLVVKKTPCYAATSVECRADDEKIIEMRAFENDVSIKNTVETPEKKPIDYSNYENRIMQLRADR